MNDFCAGELVAVSPRVGLFSRTDETKFHLEHIVEEHTVGVYCETTLGGHCHMLLVADGIVYVVVPDAIERLP